MPAKLTTHVLDTASGQPAAGVRIEVIRDGKQLFDTVTNADGRCDAPLLEGTEMFDGGCEILFHIGDYFTANGTESPFLDVVPVRFRLSSDKSFHVPSSPRHGRIRPIAAVDQHRTMGDLSKLPTAVQRAVSRLVELGKISDDPDRLIRSLLSPANVRAAEWLMSLMAELGMEVAHTRDGSVRGILPGSNPEAPPVLIGSHFDTVVDAGIYDGPLGIISALAAIETLQERGVELPYPVHVLGFSDEEGARFQTTYIGSRLMVDELDPATLATEDRDGISLAKALDEEGWTGGAAEIRYVAGSVRGYLELHIEQGRVLENLGEPACAVSDIAAQIRLNVRVNGQADHAGTTPMPLRRDALTGAAQCLLAAESLARGNEGSTITVGKIDARPGASNAIPGEVIFSVDIRHPKDGEPGRLRDELLDQFASITKDRNLDLDHSVTLDCDATPCDAEWTERLLDAVEKVTGTRRSLVSGAGHDGVALAKIAPITMIFVRCRDGLSHNPAEHASPKDIGVGIEIMARFLEDLSD